MGGRNLSKNNHRHRCCALCGARLKERKIDTYNTWEIKYCCYLCYLTDQLLPKLEIGENVYQVSRKVANYRYALIVSGENDSIYKSKFMEEEDMVMEKTNDNSDD